jgi:hypothetical protein
MILVAGTETTREQHHTQLTDLAYDSLARTTWRDVNLHGVREFRVWATEPQIEALYS